MVDYVDELVFEIRSLSRNLSTEVIRQPDAREVIKRKVPMGRGEQREDEDEEELAVDVSQRRIAQPRRRLGERLGLAGRFDYSITYVQTLTFKIESCLNIKSLDSAIAWVLAWTRVEI